MKLVRYLFSEQKIFESILKHKFIYLFLDFDGTLASIAKTPAKAFIPKETKKLLRKWSKASNCKIAVISGRALSDIKKRVGIKNIVYVGNHGFEIEGPKINFKSSLSLRYRKIINKIKDKLKAELSSIKGVFVEDKGFSLCAHYRLVDKKKIHLVEAVFYSTTLPYEIKNDIKVDKGKMILEIKPPEKWDKGKAILWLLARRIFTPRESKKKVLPIYIGDDITDENAFRVLKNRGITIFVGKPKNTEAQFYLKNTEEVAKFLRIILGKLQD